MTRRTVNPTERLRNQILTIVTRNIVGWAYGGQIDGPAINREIDELIDQALAADASQRETRRRKQLVELLRSKKR
jgi:hypothetical protein